MARHPAWANLLTTEPLAFASLTRWEGTVAELVNRMSDPFTDLDDLRRLRDFWPGRLVVEGVQHVDDARAVTDAGADVVVLSSRGGRQLDRAPVPLHLLPAVAAAIGGRAEIYLDTGILDGADAVAALAHGAAGVLVGRAYLYGLMADGERGVARAVQILETDMRRTLQLMGRRSVDETPADVCLGPGASHAGREIPCEAAPP